MHSNLYNSYKRKLHQMLSLVIFPDITKQSHNKTLRVLFRASHSTSFAREYGI